MAVAAKSLEAFLIKQGSVSETILEKARERQRDGRGLGDVLQEMGAIDGRTWAQAVATHFGLPFTEQVQQDENPAEWLELLPINFAKRNQLLPVGRDGDTVILAAADPSQVGPIDDVRLLLHRPVRVVVAPGIAIVEAINRIYDLTSGTASSVMDDLHEENLDHIGVELEETRDLLDADDEAPIIRLVNSLPRAAGQAQRLHGGPTLPELAARTTRFAELVAGHPCRGIGQGEGDRGRATAGRAPGSAPRAKGGVRHAAAAA